VRTRRSTSGLARALGVQLNAARIKDVFVMERPEALFTSTQTPFMLGDKTWIGVPLEEIIMRTFGVTISEAKYYLNLCNKVFSDSGHIESYKQMGDAAIKNACINEIRDYINNSKHCIRPSNASHGNTYHVRIPPTRHDAYKVDMQSHPDSDDDLPLPTNNFGTRDKRNATGHA
jgi:hypothetical protein